MYNLKLCGSTDKCCFSKWQALYITIEFILVLSVGRMDQTKLEVLCMDIKNEYGLLFSIEHLNFPFCQCEI